MLVVNSRPEVMDSIKLRCTNKTSIRQLLGLGEAFHLCKRMGAGDISPVDLGYRKVRVSPRVYQSPSFCKTGLTCMLGFNKCYPLGSSTQSPRRQEQQVSSAKLAADAEEVAATSTATSTENEGASTSMGSHEKKKQKKTHPSSKKTEEQQVLSANKPAADAEEVAATS